MLIPYKNRYLDLQIGYTLEYAELYDIVGFDDESVLLKQHRNGEVYNWSYDNFNKISHTKKSYQVLFQGLPADISTNKYYYPSEKWAKSKFDTYLEALNYLRLFSANSKLECPLWQKVRYLNNDYEIKLV